MMVFAAFKVHRSPELVEGRLSARRASTGSALRCFMLIEGLSPKGQSLKGQYLAWLMLGLLLIPGPIVAQNSQTVDMANVQLADQRQEDAATELMETLRCIQCQGQSIADSDAPIAAAMRSEVRQRISGGESPTQIRNLMVQRYGDWVSFQPGGDATGVFLWVLPLLILLGGIWFARGMFTKKPE